MRMKLGLPFIALALSCVQCADDPPPDDTGDMERFALDEWLAPRRRLGPTSPPEPATGGFVCGAWLVFTEGQGRQGHAEARLYRRDDFALRGVAWTHHGAIERVFGEDAFECVFDLLKAGECTACLHAWPETSASACDALVERDDRCEGPTGG